MAEHLDLEQRFGQGGTVDRDIGPARARAGSMQGTGDKLLAGAGFAGDDDIHVERRKGRDTVAQRRHRGAFAQDRMRLPQLHQGLEAQKFAARRGGLQAPRQHRQKMRGVIGFLKEILCPGAHGADRVLHVTVPRQHDHGHRQPRFPQRRKQCHAVHARHPEVGHHRIGRPQRRRGQRLGPAGEAHDGMTGRI